MLEGFGTRQRELLLLLMEHKGGMTLEDLISSLGISRTAVNQHLAGLERDGLVRKGDSRKTGGRPSATYLPTDQGINLFPKQYSWMSELLIDSLKEELGSEGLIGYFQKLASKVAKQVAHRMTGNTTEERIQQVARLLTELSYQAETEEPQSVSALLSIKATNCVYHDLATTHPEVCHFDLALMSELTNCEVEHTECMVREGQVCRFHFQPKPQ